MLIMHKLPRLLLFAALSILLIPYGHAAAYSCTGSKCIPNLSAYPATAGIPTGLIKFGSTTTLAVPSSATIAWGDGTTSTALLDCTSTPGTFCNYWGHQHIYAKPGLYKVVVTNNLGSSTSPFSLPVVAIGNFVMVSIGDSVASGEGNPVVQEGNGHSAYWDYGDSSIYPSSNGCHGSSGAGPALAARTITSDNPSARVTFIHLACSGAKVGDNISDPAAPNTATGQLKGLINLLPTGTKIDALLISAGANDVDGGFGNVVNACLGPYPGNSLYSTKIPDSSLNCRTDTQKPSNDLRSALAQFNDNPPDFPNYASLEAILTGGSLNVTSDNVYITEYFDPTHDSAGTLPTAAETLACSGNLLLTDEWRYLFNNMVVPLNQRIMGVAHQYGWHGIDGIANDFKVHGYCVGALGTSWVVNFLESNSIQGDYSGSSHPNSLGQKDYGSHIVNAIYKWQLPVTTATATSGAVPYSADTWTHDNVTVTLSATNKLTRAGKKDTKFSIDDSSCSETSTGSCTDYTAPIVISAGGIHTLYYLSDNTSGNYEKVNSLQIKIDKPVGYDNSISTTANKAISDQLQGINPNSSDTLAYNVVDQPAHGTVKLTDVNKGTFTYTPVSGYVGDDTFTFMLNNGYVDSNTATEAVTVAAAVTSGSQPSGSGSGGSGTVGPVFLAALALWGILLIQQRRVI
jgi:hypothetical protein